ncbi:MAG: glycosyltransferase [Tepidisphaeraceae bacterium]|jgi:GT2 family glycosyltransferase
MAVPYIIPFYKNQNQLDQCLAAIGKQTEPTVPWICDNNVNNLYYTKAENLGLRDAMKKGLEFAIVGTQDCYLKPTAVAELVKFMREHPRCGIAGLKQLLASDEDIVVHAGGTIAYPAGQHVGGRKSQGTGAVSCRAPWVNGACMFARLDAVLDFGLMDENMLMLGSDSDWCYTARARKWEVWYCAEAECLHEVGVSNRGGSPELVRIFQADMTYWRDKWVGSNLFARLATEFPYAPPATR